MNFDGARHAGAVAASQRSLTPAFAAARQADVIGLVGVAYVDREPDWVFHELHDAHRLVACVPGASLTRYLDSRRFEARVVVGVGPFRLAYAGTGCIVASNPRRRTASLILSGRSPANLPAVRVHMMMAVRARSGGSEIQMAFRVRLAGSGGRQVRRWVEPIARDLVDRTVHRMKVRLEEHTKDGPVL